ncbi:DUF4190 domain-containing protein [Chondromyces apiculatus]|uniref:DUF4190 domain-containing protein n=1 Tax=Chondromyces apiculatus DSM 436 TaxID=1192034 RepID=A0A017T3Y4_9BACT|nr:DUF4190 domain-containing protein [Chondromyces apiculatus]EYF03697.1 Hypothetical protein CAP_5308 [Chondromyces apiculatus DSM 436]
MGSAQISSGQDGCGVDGEPDPCRLFNATSFNATSEESSATMPAVDREGDALSSLPRAQTSSMSILSVVALFLGPVGAVAAMVLGWAARREIDEAPAPRGGRRLATVGLVLGAVFTTGWGAALALGAWAWTYDRGTLVAVHEPEPTAPATSTQITAQAAAAAPSPGGSVPQKTTVKRVGELTLVDVGIDVRTLGEELARQRATAYAVGEKVLVMTTRDPCEPCRGVERSLSEALMQTALRGVRLVRVDIDVFQEDLEELKIPSRRYPGFFLPALDLTPQDGVDGGEWDDDVPENIAPVLGAFVRGQFTMRREPWKPLPGSGVRL